MNKTWIFVLSILCGLYMCILGFKLVESEQLKSHMTIEQYKLSYPEKIDSKYDPVSDIAKAQKYNSINLTQEIVLAPILFFIGFIGFLLTFFIALFFAQITFIPINFLFQSELTNWMKLYYTPAFFTVIIWAFLGFIIDIIAIEYTVHETSKSVAPVTQSHIKDLAVNFFKENTEQKTSNKIVEISKNNNQHKINTPFDSPVKSGAASPASFYKVVAKRTYFYDKPIISNHRQDYLSADQWFLGQKIENGFIYTECLNTSGSKTIGWIKISDVIKSKSKLK